MKLEFELHPHKAIGSMLALNVFRAPAKLSSDLEKLFSFEQLSVLRELLLARVNDIRATRLN